MQRSDVGDILQKALSGTRLNREDGIRLFNSTDYAAIGACADAIRQKINGKNAYYVVNRHINYTDICKNQCKFCAYSKEESDNTGHLMSVEYAVKYAEAYWEELKFTELHIVGGLHPNLKIDYYISLLSQLKSKFPTVHLQAFTAVEIAHFAQVSGLSINETLVKLKDAGLGSMPGGGAEIFNPKVRDIICPEKIPGDKWLEIMKIAHKLGIKSNATMLYGHVETAEDIIDHLIKLRNLQDETKGFMAFIPLKFHPENTKLSDIAKPMSSSEDLKLYSISRLMLDNFEHIKVFWIMLGVKLAQTALSYGVDDFDGTVVEEKITHRAGALTPQALSVSDIKALITEAGFEPIERDTLYKRIIRNETGMFTVS